MAGIDVSIDLNRMFRPIAPLLREINRTALQEKSCDRLIKAMPADTGETKRGKRLGIIEEVYLVKYCVAVDRPFPSLKLRSG